MPRSKIDELCLQALFLSAKVSRQAEGDERDESLDHDIPASFSNSGKEGTSPGLDEKSGPAVEAALLRQDNVLPLSRLPAGLTGFDQRRLVEMIEARVKSFQNDYIERLSHLQTLQPTKLATLKAACARKVQEWEAANQLRIFRVGNIFKKALKKALKCKSAKRRRHKTLLN